MIKFIFCLQAWFKLKKNYLRTILHSHEDIVKSGYAKTEFYNAKFKKYPRILL